MLESKDKKKASLPQSKVVRKPHVAMTGGVSGGVSSCRTLQPTGGPASPSQSSYSGLGPGRGGLASTTRPQSPLKTACSSAPPPSQHKSYQAPKPAAPKPPVNTEIMKKSLRFVTTNTDSGLVSVNVKQITRKTFNCPTLHLDPFYFNCGKFH